MDEHTRLLRAAGDGDETALSALVASTQGDVWRFCAHLVDRQSADDLTQEVFVRAMRAAPRFRGDASARTWLLSIARRVAADEIRVRQRRRRPLPAAWTPSAAPDESEALALRDLDGALADADQRDAFVLTQLLGLPYADAAEVCAVPVGTIRSRVSRARERLTAMLEDPAPAPSRRERVGTDGR